MRYLLDTHTFLWWIVADSQQISTIVRDLIEDPENEIALSVASAWEIAIKAQLGRLRLHVDPASLIPDHIRTNGFTILSIQIEHALHVYSLPLLHRDPFDRILIAQSQVNDLPLLTRDAAITQYDVRAIW